MERGNFKNLVNKEHDHEKLSRKRSEKFTEKHSEQFGEKSNVKMGKRGGGGQYVRKRKN
jgi:hypothetical protein